MYKRPTCTDPGCDPAYCPHCSNTTRPSATTDLEPGAIWVALGIFVFFALLVFGPRGKSIPRHMNDELRPYIYGQP